MSLPYVNWDYIITNDNYLQIKVVKNHRWLGGWFMDGMHYCASSVIIMNYYSVFSLLLLCVFSLLVCHLYLHKLVLLLPSVSMSLLGLLLDLFFCFGCGLRCSVHSGIPIMLWILVYLLISYLFLFLVSIPL